MEQGQEQGRGGAVMGQPLPVRGEWHAVTKFIEQLDEKYGKLPCGKKTPLNVTRGKIHDYLGMTLDYSKPGKVYINMTEYLTKILDDLSEDDIFIMLSPIYIKC